MRWYLENFLKNAEKIQSAAKTLHKPEIKLSSLVYEIQSLDGNAISLVAKSLTTCATSISNAKGKLNTCSEMLMNVAQCYENTEKAVKERSKSPKSTQTIKKQKNDQPSSMETLDSAIKAAGTPSAVPTSCPLSGEGLRLNTVSGKYFTSVFRPPILIR